jgi:hypothetical protein
MRAARDMAFKLYLETIRRTCAPLTKDQLLEMILPMAREVRVRNAGNSRT